MTWKTEVGCAHSVADVTARTTWSCDDSCVSASTAILCSLVGLSHDHGVSRPALQVSRNVDVSDPLQEILAGHRDVALLQYSLYVIREALLLTPRYRDSRAMNKLSIQYMMRKTIGLVTTTSIHVDHLSHACQIVLLFSPPAYMYYFFCFI